MKAVFVLALCIAAASARSAYQLPSGVELLRSQVITSFSCAGRPYGYFADVANDCAIFHVCYPVNDELGNVSRFVAAASPFVSFSEIGVRLISFVLYYIISFETDIKCSTLNQEM